MRHLPHLNHLVQTAVDLHSFYVLGQFKRCVVDAGVLKFLHVLQCGLLFARVVVLVRRSSTATGATAAAAGFRFVLFGFKSCLECRRRRLFVRELLRKY